MLKKVRTYNLEIATAKKFEPKENFAELISTKEVNKSTYISFMMFVGVGLPYAWGERLLWNNEQWNTYQANENIYLYLGFKGNTLVGYFELNRTDKLSIEIKYFGLLPEYTGQGLGGHFLSATIDQCYKLGAEKVWLHTCEYDSPKALDNYKARGFEVVNDYISEEFVPTREKSIELTANFFRNYISTFEPKQ